MSGLTQEQRRHHAVLFRAVAATVKTRSESANGYSFGLDGAQLSESELAEWMSLELRCCPFLQLRLDAEGQARTLHVEGPPGVKEFIAVEFHTFFEEWPA